MSRLQNVSRTSGSNTVTGFLNFHDQIESKVNACSRSGSNDDRRFAFLHNAGTLQLVAWTQAIAVVHRCLDETARLGKVGQALTLPRSAVHVASVRGEAQVGGWTRHANAPAHDLHRHVRWSPT